MSSKRIIYYYQTFIGLENILNKEKPDVTHIIVSSIHFGLTSDNKPYIHLNDYPPYDPRFDKLWEQLEELNFRGVKIMLMVGGAGGAYKQLFTENYDTYKNLLLNLLYEKSFIEGIDFDVEETVTLDNIVKFICDIERKMDNEDFVYTMAPVMGAMISDEPGMGGFRYKDLLKTKAGKIINWFNVQSYYEFTEKIYDTIVLNGYDSSKIVLGMINSQFNSDNFQKCLNILQNISKKYKDNFGGVDIWEYTNSPPDINDPSKWAFYINKVINNQK